MGRYSSPYTRTMPTYSATQFDKPVEPTQADQLKFYGLFKQAKEGDNTKPKPGMMDFAGKAKWGAWNDVKGLDADEAKSQYVEYFIQVLDKAGNPEAAKIKEQVLAA